MKERVLIPFVTVNLSTPYDESEQKLFNQIIEVYALDECRINRQEATKKIKSIFFNYDEFLQIYATLLVELDRQLSQIKNLTTVVQSVATDFSIHTWYLDTQILLRALKDFREAEYDYFKGRVALSRSILLKNQGKE